MTGRCPSGRSAVLRTEPLRVSALRAAAAIAGLALNGCHNPITAESEARRTIDEKQIEIDQQIVKILLQDRARITALEHASAARKSA